MKKKLDIRKLLVGTPYEDKADLMAKRIEVRGWDNDRDIWSLPQEGATFFGESAYSVVQTIVKRANTIDVPKEPLPEPEEPENVKFSEATASASVLAEEHGIDLSTVQGTGRSGVIVKADVEKLIA